MKKPDWAREKVERVSLRLDIHSGYFKQKDVIDLLKAERSRTRRIVRAVRKSCGGAFRNHDAMRICDEILRRLQ